ncbi:MAG: FkbM family methyltransferase [Gammaproteobacteria bacterium]|nr:FkbM family methyltransferase [Gammaproteobacteria bacterium]
MSSLISRKLANVRARLVDRVLEFKPFIKTLSIGSCDLRFFYATSQAVDWYDPLGPHLHAEFEWLQQRIAGRVETIIDAGAYHGLYAMVMARAAAPGSRVVAVDPVASNAAIMEANFAINGLDIEIVQAAVSDADAPISFTRESCGRIVQSGGLAVAGRKLTSILPEATVAKIDIEGAEFSVLPQQIDAMPTVHTWIVEIHPDFGFDPAIVLDLFRARSFELLVLNRQAARVQPLASDAPWTERTSLIALGP